MAAEHLRPIKELWKKIRESSSHQSSDYEVYNKDVVKAAQDLKAELANLRMNTRGQRNGMDEWAIRCKIFIDLLFGGIPNSLIAQDLLTGDQIDLNKEFYEFLSKVIEVESLRKSFRSQFGSFEWSSATFGGSISKSDKSNPEKIKINSIMILMTMPIVKDNKPFLKKLLVDDRDFFLHPSQFNSDFPEINVDTQLSQHQQHAHGGANTTTTRFATNMKTLDEKIIEFNSSRDPNDRSAILNFLEAKIDEIWFEQEFYQFKCSSLPPKVALLKDERGFLAQSSNNKGGGPTSSDYDSVLSESQKIVKREMLVWMPKSPSNIGGRYYIKRQSILYYLFVNLLKFPYSLQSEKINFQGVNEGAFIVKCLWQENIYFRLIHNYLEYYMPVSDSISNNSQAFKTQQEVFILSHAACHLFVLFRC